jgi:CRP-like cAMP-binding protein
VKNEPQQLCDLFLFRGVPEAAQGITLPEPISFGAGEDIYTEQDYRRALGVVLSGRAAADPGGDGKALLSVFEPGAVFGAAALFGEETTYVSRVRAVSDCRILFLSEEWLLALFAAYPQTAVNYVRFLSSRIRFLNGKISLFTQSNTESKVYGFLVDRCDEQGNLPRLNFSRMAEQLGVGRTSLYRALDLLEQKHIIVREDRKIQVIL